MNQKNQLLIKIAFALLLFIESGLSAKAQNDSVSAAGSTSFKTNGSKKFWMGANYRKEWLTPIKAPVLNMSSEKGGLTPLKRGGGKQTKSLRVEDPTGRQYTFRSIQKFITAKTLPPDLQSQAAEDIVSDGVSASYPYSALSISPLSEAAGIPYNKVKLVYIPDDARMGEFRDDFKNMLALFEERLPEGVDKGYDSEEVVDKLKDDNDNSVDQLALLRIRILDMFVMDFDRHERQWTWAATENGKGKKFFPIARDRDQAFFTNQGFIPGLVKRPWLLPQLEGFKAKATNINRFNFAARNFDRFFLTELSEQDWKNAVDDFLPKMTDEVIEKAFRQQPPEIRSFSADKLMQKLKDRRKYLAAEVMQYYRFLAQTVSISGSDKKELFDITRNDDGSVHVQVFKITKEGGQSIKMYDRLFNPADTKEIRLYAFGGDDKFSIKGGESKIRIRMIGGDGQDVFENTSKGGGAIVYDLKDGKNKLSGNLRNKMANDTIVNSYNWLDFKYNQVIPFLSFNYNRDDGLYLGISLKVIRQGFRKSPFKTMHQFNISHSLATNAFNFRYNSEYIGVLGKTGDLLTDFDIKAPDNTTNFFGYGDNSVYDKSKPGKFRYYRARYNLSDFSLLLRKRFSEKVMIALGPTYEFYKLDSTNNIGKNIVTTIPGVDKTTLFGKQSYFGGKFSLAIDTRDNKVIPQKGIYWQTTYRYLSGLNDRSNSISQLNSDLSFYIQLARDRLVFADRVGAGVNFGDFQFYQSQYLGSDEDLRGYRKYRFAGKSKIFNNAELRLRVANFRTYLFPAAFGILGFYDAGKIYDQNGVSNRWVSGYGGGIWFSPMKRLVISFSYAASKEDKLPLFGLGWKF